jgi:hypothetical protein
MCLLLWQIGSGVIKKKVMRGIMASVMAELSVGVDSEFTLSI